MKNHKMTRLGLNNEALRKLSLKRKTLRQLDNSQLHQVNGAISGNRLCNLTISIDEACDTGTADFFCTVAG
ncbi:hypothetical protein [Haliangium sp.]|uniref:hypothetical protein n=1 Tax=Haliangium sp. TaxID=2663208 RepID=UPI003D14D168